MVPDGKMGDEKLVSDGAAPLTMAKGELPLLLTVAANAASDSKDTPPITASFDALALP